MKSLATYQDKTRQPATLTDGFTLIEILIVVGILAILASVGLFFGFDDLRAHTFHANRDVLISALQHARSEAVANICRGEDEDGNECEDGKPHGVYIDDDEFVIFQGADFANRDQDSDIILEANENVDYDNGINEVVFAQLSGDVGTPGQIILIDDISHRESTITINSEGQIEWTN